MQKPLSIILLFALDVALWYCLPVAFAIAYVQVFSGSVGGAFLHLVVIALPLVAILLARLTISRYVARAILSRTAATAVTGSVLVALILYYGLVIVGLSSWRAVISWDVVPSFLTQVPQIAEVIGFPRYLVFLLAALLCAGVFALTWRYLQRLDWTDRAAPRLHQTAWMTTVVGGLLVMAGGCWGLASGVGVNVSEPLSLTLFPKAGDVVDLEGHAIDRLKASVQDHLEDMARHASPTPKLPRRKQWIELNGQQVDFEGHVVNLEAAGAQDRSDETARAGYATAGSVYATAGGGYATAGAGYATAVTGGPTNLVLIVVDALRPDHMGLYGYNRDTTPNLSALSRTRDVRVVSGVHASCGDTICGLLSLSSSKFPRNFSLHPITLHEVLHRSGYRLHLILTGDHSYFYSLRSFYGDVDDYYDGTQAKGYFINDDQLALDRLAQTPAFDGTPAMFQFHVMSSHVLRSREKTPGKFQPATSYVIHRAQDTGPGSSPDPAAINYYDNGVVRTDEVIAELLSTLERKGYLKKALVVITADHGESLGEHGLYVHANSVREQLLRIPLVFIAYGYHPEPLQPHALAAQVDIAPTILAEIGIPRPTTWVGHPLQERAGDSLVYFEEHEDSGVIDGRDPSRIWKYWRNAKTGREQVYDLSSDPDENRDAIGDVPLHLRAEWRSHSGGETVAAR